jgi:hypothetical protein
MNMSYDSLDALDQRSALLREAGEYNLEQLAIEPNGHRILTQPVLAFTVLAHMLEAPLKQLLQVRRDGALPLSQPLSIGTVNSLHRCYYCGEYPQLETDGVVIRAAAACPAVDGVLLEFDLEVPSGAIVVADYLRVFSVKDEDRFDLNTAVGQAGLSQAMAAIGCAYGGIGNSCPGIYRVSDQHYVIASPGWDGENEVPPPGEQVAHVVTDLWAYSIADEARFRARGGTEDPGFPYDRVAVTPGTYHFTHHTFRRDFTDDVVGRPTVYAEFRLKTAPVSS